MSPCTERTAFCRRTADTFRLYHGKLHVQMQESGQSFEWITLENFWWNLTSSASLPKNQCDRPALDFNAHYCWMLSFSLFWGRAGLHTWLENMGSVYFYLGTHKSFWTVKMQSKEVVAIAQASHAENLLTKKQFIIYFISFFQPFRHPYFFIRGSMIDHKANIWQVK